MYHRLGVVPSLRSCKLAKFAHNEIASHLPFPGGSRNFDQNRLMISLGCCGAEASKKNWEISRDNLDLFSWWCFRDYTMGFITIIHHHLGEYFWNFCPGIEPANPRQGMATFGVTNPWKRGLEIFIFNESKGVVELEEFSGVLGVLPFEDDFAP